MNVSTVPAYVARTQLGSLLSKIAKERRRFIITKTGVPRAVLLSIADFDDMLEELDPIFQKSLKMVAAEIKAGKGISLQQYLKQHLSKRR